MRRLQSRNWVTWGLTAAGGGIRSLGKAKIFVHCLLSLVIPHPHTPCSISSFCVSFPQLYSLCLFLPMKICGTQESNPLWFSGLSAGRAWRWEHLWDKDLKSFTQNSPSHGDYSSQNLKSQRREKEYIPLGCFPREHTVIHSPAWKRAILFWRAGDTDKEKALFLFFPHPFSSLSLFSFSFFSFFQCPTSFIYSSARSGK